MEKFEESARQLRVELCKKLTLDCKTRWNSTYLMLQIALDYKQVFSRLNVRDPNYKSLPSETDWHMAGEICRRLKVFYKATELFSGTEYPTANLYFPKICEIKLALNNWVSFSIGEVQSMAVEILNKFNNYWSDVHGIMGVATVLDPSGYDLYASQRKRKSTKSELDLYLDEDVLPRTPDFDVLSWWNSNKGKYPILHKIARDILGIPISTVAFESAFSKSGRLTSPHRSRLHHKTIEALMCSQSWMQCEQENKTHGENATVFYDSDVEDNET
ncbi:Zinc finger BED domain-containing protein DAYSLEEPER [Striga hermonthica]|uniref:Zinc finger BED domain-containing protein DAYSLEEPER n=1 Tax=Striga hermonthica TaxID=68872 RepID=A0A9N7MJ76_STRHE|nr:Zinc finger BED domain-containing protein DAYSLEEPER [Striga hermonthica]